VLPMVMLRAVWQSPTGIAPRSWLSEVLDSRLPVTKASTNPMCQAESYAD